MGLSIGSYQRAYSTLQRLRRMVLEIEDSPYTLEEVYGGAETKFDAFINHSDCEGCYISYGGLDIRTIIFEDDNRYMVGDLDKLKEEMAMVQEAIENDHPAFKDRDGDKQAFEDFVEDVEEAYLVLQFR